MEYASIQFWVIQTSLHNWTSHSSIVLNFVISFLSFQMSTLSKQILNNVLLDIHDLRAHNYKLNSNVNFVNTNF